MKYSFNLNIFIQIMLLDEEIRSSWTNLLCRLVDDLLNLDYLCSLAAFPHSQLLFPFVHLSNPPPIHTASDFRHSRRLGSFRKWPSSFPSLRVHVPIRIDSWSSKEKRDYFLTTTTKNNAVQN